MGDSGLCCCVHATCLSSANRLPLFVDFIYLLLFFPSVQSLEEADTPRSPLEVTGRSVGSARPELLQTKMSINKRYGGGSDRHNYGGNSDRDRSNGGNRTFTNNRQREPPTPRGSNNRSQRGATRGRTEEKELRYGLRDKRMSEPRYGRENVEMDKPRYKVSIVPELDEDSLDEGDRYEDADNGGRAPNERDALYEDYDERYDDNHEGSDGDNDMDERESYDEKKEGYDNRQHTYDVREEDNRQQTYDARETRGERSDNRNEENRDDEGPNGGDAGNDQNGDKTEENSDGTQQNSPQITYRYDKLFMSEE